MDRTVSYTTIASSSEGSRDDPDDPDTIHSLAPISPQSSRRPAHKRIKDQEYPSALLTRSKSAGLRMADENTSLLGTNDGASYTSIPPSIPVTTPGSPRGFGDRQNNFRNPRHARRGSFSMRLVSALGAERRFGLDSSIHEAASLYKDNRVWYDQFTSTDWVHDSIADAYRVKALRNRKDWRGRILAWLDGGQGWLLVLIIGILTAMVAYFVNVTESTLFDYKSGHCSTAWYYNRKKCCEGASICENWIHWSGSSSSLRFDDTAVGYSIFIFGCVLLSCLSCMVTLSTKTVIPSAISLSTLDENLGADDLRRRAREEDQKISDTQHVSNVPEPPPMVYYAAGGSGVAEVKVILSGFVLHGYLGVRTLVLKTFGLILSVASGLSLGKEGPYVHIATCIGNIVCRLFSKYNYNDAKRREVLSASAAAGVAVAFGAPIGGVLFSLEEVSYYFPPKTLFRTFFCCIAAALSLKFLNPYGTNKIVLFEVRYLTDWQLFEMVAFVLIGVIGGLLGALFIKACRFWARTFRRISFIKKYPISEVFLVALVTGILSYWNRYTKLPVAELLFELASPCDTFTDSGTDLCPTKEHIPDIVLYLSIAFVVKAFLTVVTFGIKVPAGIYVPSMVVGGLVGRIVGHLVQYLALNYAHTGLFGSCDPNSAPETCVVPGVYAMAAAGATMTGVTRLTVTLSVILFELTGSLDYVLPFSIGILVAKWTADFLEPLSIYDLLMDMNSYPFLDNKIRPIFTTELGDITSNVGIDRVIDISNSPMMLASELRQKLEILQAAGELDGGLTIVRDGILVGLIPAPDLEFALDKLPNEDNSLCLMSTRVGWNNPSVDEEEEEQFDPTDFTHYIDPAPVALDIHSPMDLVYECFVKLGLRYICVLRDGRYAGLVHKKTFVKYMKELEKKSH